MAPALTSNSFLLNTPPHPRLTLKSPSFRLHPKRAGPLAAFRFGKQSDGASERQENESNNSTPFSFNFGKVSDVSSLIPVVTKPSSGLSFGRRNDPGTVFVAGATGQAGIRIAQALLREGFSVRAGVPELAAAQELALLAAKYKIISKEESKRLNAVESSFQDAESIAKAIGNASKVVVTIGPGENGPTSEVTTSDALQVIQAADLAGVGHVAIIYDGSPFLSSTYNVLDGITTFFNNLFSGSLPLTVPEFLQKVVETNLSYTLIKTNLTEDFSPESSYNVVVSAEGSYSSNDYKVATYQIASLVANVFSNTAVAENKVVKVFTVPKAPSKPVAELFSAIPKDRRREAYAEAQAKAKAEEEALKATEKGREAAKATKKLEQEVKKLSDQETIAQEAKEKAEAARASMEGLFSKAKDLSAGLSWEKFSSQLTTAAQKPTEKPKVQIATVRGQAKARSLQPKKAVVKLPTFPRLPASKSKEAPKPKGKQPESKVEVRKVLGGLFKQETIYIDDD